jgi:hypothetical protein
MVLAAAAVGVYAFVPESPLRTPARVDWVGAVLFAPGLTAILLGLSQGTNWG